MTQRIAFFLLMLVAANYACKKTDNALSGQLQEYVNTFTKVNADLQTAATELGEVKKMLDAAPSAAVKDTTELHNLKERLQMISNRVTVRTVEYADILKKMQELSSGYNTGKFTTEQVNREIKLFGDRLKGAPDFTQGVLQGLSDIKMSALKLTGDGQIQ